MKNVLKISFAYLAAVIGAGFASGSEIIHYFMRFGNAGIFGILLVSAGFGMFAFLVLDICRRNGVSDFESMLKIIMPPFLQKYIKVVTVLFTAIVLGGMISAFAVLVHEYTGLSLSVGGGIFSLICGAILMMPEETVIKNLGRWGVFIVLFICILCIYMINNRCVKVFSQCIEMPVAAFSYMSYNIVSVCPFLCSASKSLKNNRDCVCAGIITSVMFLFCLGLIWCILSVYYGKIELGDMPMLTVAARQGKFFGIIYASVIAAAVLTSAVSGGFGIIHCMKNINFSFKTKIFLTVSIGYVLSSIGFNSIVSVLYNVAGIASLILPLKIFLKFLNKVVF